MAICKKGYTLETKTCGMVCEACEFYDERTKKERQQAKAEALMEAGYGNVKEAVKEALQKEREKEIKKQEAFAEEMGFAPDASPYYIARKYKEKFEYAMKELAEARKEVFMEIMEVLRFGYELPIGDIAREMAKGYGVEVCDEK